MTDKPDFEALRAERNKAVLERLQQFAKEHGVLLDSLRTTFNPNACFCNCPEGPCEHDWNGPEYVADDDGCLVSATCSRCGMTAFHHDMRVAP